MDSKKRIVVIAELSIVPIGEKSTSLRKYVAEAVNAIKKLKVRCEVTAMGTILEAEKLEDILKSVEVAHKALFRSGVKRVVSTLKIDDRRDKPRMLADKVKAVERLLAKK